MVCFLDTNNVHSVGHYYLEGKTLKLLDNTSPDFGITNSAVKNKGNRAFCSFNRKNFINKDKYVNSLDEHFLIAALGSGK